MRRPSEPVLLVDDSYDDRLLMGEAWREAGIGNVLQPAEDGAQAIDYLTGAGAYSDRELHPLPCLMLLDLKMPVRTGFETLSWLRAHESLRSLPVIILTASVQPSDIDECYRLGANSFLVKPSTLDELCVLTRAIKAYWLEQNLFPAFSRLS